LAVPANSGTRFGDLRKQRRNGADGAFFVSVAYASPSYGGRVGQPSGWPVSFVTGSPTLHVRHPCRNGMGGSSEG